MICYNLSTAEWPECRKVFSDHDLGEQRARPKSGNHFATKSLEIFPDEKVGITSADASNDWSLGETIEDQSNLITDNIYYQTYLLVSAPFSIGKKNYGFY